MARGLSFVPRTTGKGGRGEEGLNSLYRNLIENITSGVFEADQITLQDILEPNPRGPHGFIYAPPGEPTLTITKPQFLGQAVKSIPKVTQLAWDALGGGHGKRLGLYAEKVKRGLRALPEEALKGVKRVGSVPASEGTGVRAMYARQGRKIGVTPRSQNQGVGDIAHEAAHDYGFYPPARLPLEVKRDVAVMERIHLDLRKSPFYEKDFYKEDPFEVSARMMGAVSRAWPSKKAIPNEAYDKLYGAAVKTALKSYKKNWPDFYRETVRDIPWETP